jgi:hypothetical protein
MPHLAGRCDCGRKMHFPKNATIGYQWNCHKCGKVWTLSNHGKPLHSQSSKTPPKRKTSSSHSSNKPASGGSGININGILVLVGTIILLYFVFKK